VLLLNDLFVQLNSNNFVMCHVQIFEQIKMDGRRVCDTCVLQFEDETETCVPRNDSRRESRDRTASVQGSLARRHRYNSQEPGY